MSTYLLDAARGMAGTWYSYVIAVEKAASEFLHITVKLLNTTMVIISAERYRAILFLCPLEVRNFLRPNRTT